MGYWVVSIGLTAFGLVAMLSIGRPFLLVGLAMLVLGPFRSRPAVFWPLIAAVVAYNVGYWAVAPYSCAATQAVGGISTTTCSSLIGIGYSGTGLYNPSLDPANQVGLFAAAVTFVVVLAATLWRGRRGGTRA